MTDPMTPPECDLAGFDFMPLDVSRLLKSDTWINAASVPHLSHALISLWAEAWRQVPAASLPTNDKVQQRLSMVEGKWPKVRAAALADWVECSDGRLYHPVVAEKALEAWLEKLAQRLSSGAGNAKRWGTTFDTAPIEAQMITARSLLARLNPQSRALTKKRTSGAPKKGNRDSDQHPDGIPPGSQETETGTNTSVPNGTGAATAPPAGPPQPKTPDEMTKQELWTAGKSLLIEAGVPKAQCGSYVGILCKDYGEEVVHQAVLATVKANPPDPRSYLKATCQRLVGERKPNGAAARQPNHGAHDVVEPA